MKLASPYSGGQSRDKQTLSLDQKTCIGIISNGILTSYFVWGGIVVLLQPTHYASQMLVVTINGIWEMNQNR